MTLWKALISAGSGKTPKQSRSNFSWLDKKRTCVRCHADMKNFINRPEDVVEELLEGLIVLYPASALV